MNSLCLISWPRNPGWIIVVSHIILSVICLLVYFFHSSSNNCLFQLPDSFTFDYQSQNTFFIPNVDEKERIPKLNRDSPLIFVGGLPRSGTTLARVLLDSHPDVSCGPETRMVSKILNMVTTWKNDQIEWKRLQLSGISDEIFDSSIASFILEVMARHNPGKRASRICNKDTLTFRSLDYLYRLFPNSRFLFIIRDGRAMAHSTFETKVNPNYNISEPREALKRWNAQMEQVWNKCSQLGPRICFPVKYEELVLHPKATMKNILKFLSLRWNDSVLHHDLLVKSGQIRLSPLSFSAHSVLRPINTKSLAKWVGTYPEDVIRDMDRIAPMLRKLGYDPEGNPPNYGEPDASVQLNMVEIRLNEQLNARVQEVEKKREKLRNELWGGNLKQNGLEFQDQKN